MPASMNPQGRLFRRYDGNPILTAQQWPYPVNAVFNAGAARLANGETLLLCRVEDCSGRSHLCCARSADGVGNWRIDARPTFPPDAENHPEEMWGVEDPRVVWLTELKKYAVIYTGFSRRGPAVSLALTEDFAVFERLGMIMLPEDKDAALLPRRVGDKWAMIHRPAPRSDYEHIWISFSPDLIHWGDHRVLLQAKRGPWWDAHKIGLSTPLIETPEGWLMLYHGAHQTPGGCLYRLGLALLDLEDPTKVVLRGVNWVFGPQTEYERTGDVPNVAFPCGYTIGDDGDTLNLYYGAADTTIALATGKLNEMLNRLKDDSELDNIAFF